MKNFYLLIGLVVCTLTACGPSPVEIAAQTKGAATANASSWTEAPTRTPTTTFTSAPTLTPTPTITPTSTVTLTPTPEILTSDVIVTWESPWDMQLESFNDEGGCGDTYLNVSYDPSYLVLAGYDAEGRELYLVDLGPCAGNYTTDHRLLVIPMDTSLAGENWAFYFREEPQDIGDQYVVMRVQRHIPLNLSGDELTAVWRCIVDPWPGDYLLRTFGVSNEVYENITSAGFAYIDGLWPDRTAEACMTEP